MSDPESVLLHGTPSSTEQIQEEGRHSYLRMMRRVRIFLGAMFSLLALLAWVTDFITPKGEWTVYTAECKGTWNNDHCAGKLVAGQRFRFRARKARREVVFWTVGGAETVGTLSPCVVEDGRNWSCQGGPDSARSLTLVMSHGEPQSPASRHHSFYEMPKLRWLLLRHLGV